jgi:hypothetical protein
MMKRVTWFVAGAATGAAGAIATARKVRRTAERLAPTNVARSAVDGIRVKAHDVADAVREGRAVMVAKEQQLRAMRDGHPVAFGLTEEPVLHAEVVGGTAAVSGHRVHDLAAWRQRGGRRGRH